jgi:hypothetical protein
MTRIVTRLPFGYPTDSTTGQADRDASLLQRVRHGGIRSPVKLRSNAAAARPGRTAALPSLETGDRATEQTMTTSANGRSLSPPRSPNHVLDNISSRPQRPEDGERMHSRNVSGAHSPSLNTSSQVNAGGQGGQSVSAQELGSSTDLKSRSTAPASANGSPRPRTLAPNESLLLALPPEIVQNHIHPNLTLQEHGRLNITGKSVQYQLGDLPKKLHKIKLLLDRVASDFNTNQTSQFTPLQLEEIGKQLNGARIPEHQRDDIVKSRLSPSLNQWASQLNVDPADYDVESVFRRLDHMLVKAQNRLAWPESLNPIKYLPLYALANEISKSEETGTGSLRAMFDRVLALDDSVNAETSISLQGLCDVIRFNSPSNANKQKSLDDFFDQTERRPKAFQGIALLGLACRMRSGTRRRLRSGNEISITALFDAILDRANRLEPWARDAVREALKEHVGELAQGDQPSRLRALESST